MAYWISGAAPAAALYEESLVVARRSGNPKDIPRALTSLASVVFEEGEFERAQILWGEALALHKRRGEALGAASVLSQLGYSELAAKGNVDRARALLEEALILGRESEHEQTVADVLLCLGLAALLQDDPEQAKLLLQDSLAIDLKLERKAELAEDLEGLAEAAGTLGQDLRAARLWGAADKLRRVSRPWSSTERMLHEPQLVAARSRLGEAAWEKSFAEGQAMTFEEAVKYALTEREPEPSEGPTHLAPPTDEPVSSLTRREREVATLVARGCTNRQVANELSISERTAGNHVAKVLKKLGLASRVQIASWVAGRQSLAADQD